VAPRFELLVVLLGTIIANWLSRVDSLQGLGLLERVLVDLSVLHDEDKLVIRVCNQVDILERIAID
jgi:hypothetical protein